VKYRVGGQSWTKLFIFLFYRPACLIEAYDRLEKYWLVWAGLLAYYLFNFIFLSNGLMAAVERAAGPANLYHC
jgi:hypothetical protein